MVWICDDQGGIIDPGYGEALGVEGYLFRPVLAGLGSLGGAVGCVGLRGSW